MYRQVRRSSAFLLLLLAPVEQEHITAAGPLMLDSKRKCQHVSLPEIKVVKVEPTQVLTYVVVRLCSC